MTKPTLIALTLALAACASAAQACETDGRKVLEVMTDTVGTYDAEGNLLADVPKAQIKVGENVLKCQDTPALVLVSLHPKGDGKPLTAWVNLLEVKIGKGTQTARECKPETVSRLADTTAPATSGIDPCSNAAQHK